jgi:outer membrane autotransporter protein
VTPPAFGEAQVEGLILTFTPGEENAGATFLEYVIELPFGDSAPGRIDLVALAVVETQTLTAQTLAGVPVTVRITDDVRGGPFTESAVVSVSPVEAGEATIRAAGSGAYDLTYAPQGAFSGEAVVTFTLGNGVSTATSTLTVTVEPRPDPSLDPDVRGLAASQVTTARRFADAQISNFQRRLETLRHGDNPSSNGVTLNVGFGRNTPERDPRVELARQLRAPELDPGARHDPEREFMGQDLWAGRQGASMDGVDDASGGAPVGLQSQASRGREEGGPSVGVWTAGSIDWGRQNAEGQRDQRFRTQGLTVGVDARLTDRLIVGGGIGYGRDRSEIGENGSLSRARSLTGAVYGSWRITDAAFLDGVAGHGELAFDSRRWAEGLGGQADAFALGERDGSVRFVSGTIGRITGEGSLRRSLYLRLDARNIQLDAFTETGAGLASLSWDALEQDSLSASLGVAWSWRIDMGERGGLSPYARIEWSRELERLDEQGVRYADWAAGPTYWAPLDGWSRDSLNLNLGAEWTLRDLLIASAGYRGQLGDASQSHGGELSLKWSW